MRVLITGGTGLIGRALITHLLPQGHTIWVLSRRPQQARLPHPVQVLGWDARTPHGWGHVVNQVDAIIHLAGENLAGTGPIPARWTASRKQRILESRVQSTQAVVQAIQQAETRPRVLVQGSAVGYYGARRDDQVLEEDAPPGDDFLARVVVQWEEASQGVEDLGVRRVLARTGLVLSTQGGSLPSMLLPFRFYLGGPLGDGRQWWPWIHIQDEVRALAFLMAHDQATGPFNLVAPEPVTQREFARVLGQVLGKPARVPVPAWALRLALGEMATLLLDGQRAVPSRLLALGFQFQFPTLEAALRDLVQET